MSAKNMVVGRGICDEPVMRRKTGDQFLDNADSYINPLDHLDSFHFFHQTLDSVHQNYGSPETQTIAANV